MSKISLTRPFADAVAAESINHLWMDSEYRKSKAVLKAYAANNKVNLTELQLLDICHDRNCEELNPYLRSFIEKLPESKGYKQQVITRIKRILRALPWSTDRDEKLIRVPPPTPELPEVLEKVLPLLPRQGTTGCPGRVIQRCESEKRLEHPLTTRGLELLKVLLQVVEAHAITDLDSLLVSHNSDVRLTIRRTLPSNRWLSINTKFTDVRRLLGYDGQRSTRKSVDYDDWPVTLRRQFDRFKETAPYGIEQGSTLRAQAAEHKVSIEPLEESTISHYEEMISRGLFHIFSRLEAPPADLDVRDLLTIEVEEYESGGARQTRSFNHFIDLFREPEKRRATKAKRAGFDSIMFAHFLNAIKAVAAFNGYFTFHAKFNDAYRLNPDRKQKKDNKKAKKQTFDLDWIDGEMTRMLVDFRRIVKEKSFRHDNYKNGLSLKQTRKNMRFCLFFVLLTMLRYLGPRQQVIRNCAVGKRGNVEFGNDGSIHFNWQEDLTKNDTEIDQVYSEWEHQTHKIMIEVLAKYYNVIYRPYILKNCATTPDGKDLIENQLFVQITSSGKFRRFEPDNTSSFYTKIKNWSSEFMDFGDRANRLEKGLHPHFFRGLAVDWMVNVHKVPLEKAADYFGISIKTLMQHYLQKDRRKSAAPALEAANAKYKEKASKEREEALLKQLSDKEAAYQEELARKDKLLEEKDQRIYELQNRIYELQNQLIDALKKRGAA